MARDLQSGVITTIDSHNTRPLLLVRFEYDDAPLNVWTGYGDLLWNSITFQGTGELGQISPVKETLGLEATGLKFSLSGIPSDKISLALSEDYQNRLVKLWLGYFDSSGNIIPDPFQLFKGRMDIMEITEGGETSTISISAENMLIILKKASERRYTNEDQKLDFPDDKGFDQVAILNDGRQVLWGNG